MSSRSVTARKTQSIVRTKQSVVAAIVSAMHETGLTKSDLARRMRTSRSLVDRMLDPTQETNLGTLVKAAAAVGKHIDIIVTDPPIVIQGARA